MSAGWNTIESDAGVFTYLLTNLGVRDVQFEELISLDADLLRQQAYAISPSSSIPNLQAPPPPLWPPRAPALFSFAYAFFFAYPSLTASTRPIYGVIFLFKYPTGEKPSSTPKDGTFDLEAAENLFFASQTIQNACGTQALLSVLLNKDGEVDIGDNLREFKEFTGAFPSELRGEALSNSELIRDVHNSFARSSPFISEESRSATTDDDIYHFIAYTSLHNTLYELDGLQPAPISHGPCTPTDFPTKVIPVLQRRIARYPANEIRFNLLAMVRDLRIKARETGDGEVLWQEEQKRKGWRWENALRRHNFVGFIAEVVKGVAACKLQEGDGTYNKWIEDAKSKTKNRYEEKKEKAGEDVDIEVEA